jgi:hypothetical protein
MNEWIKGTNEVIIKPLPNSPLVGPNLILQISIYGDTWKPSIFTSPSKMDRHFNNTFLIPVKPF